MRRKAKLEAGWPEIYRLMNGAEAIAILSEYGLQVVGDVTTEVSAFRR